MLTTGLGKYMFGGRSWSTRQSPTPSGNLERHGAGWEFVRDGVGGDGEWPLYLQRYVALFEHAV